ARDRARGSSRPAADGRGPGREPARGLPRAARRPPRLARAQLRARRLAVRTDGQRPRSGRAAARSARAPGRTAERGGDARRRRPLSFLAPLALLGLLGLSRPPIAHLLGRERPQKIRFAAVRFVTPREPVITQRRELR